MGSLLIKDVRLDDRITDVLIADGRFKSLEAPAGTVADKVIDASGMAICPRSTIPIPTRP